MNANGNVGVGLGPIHIGVGAGGGVNTHVYPTPNQDIPMLDQRSNSSSQQTSIVPVSMHVTSALSTSAPVLSATITAADRPIFISEDTNANNYYYTYVPPRVVTIGGFSATVSGNPMYFSLFKHRTGPLPLHNHKGEDLTAGYGESPRAGSYGESIGGMAYSATPLPQQTEPPIVEALPAH